MEEYAIIMLRLKFHFVSNCWSLVVCWISILIMCRLRTDKILYRKKIAQEHVRIISNNLCHWFLLFCSSMFLFCNAKSYKFSIYLCSWRQNTVKWSETARYQKYVSNIYSHASTLYEKKAWQLICFVCRKHIENLLHNLLAYVSEFVLLLTGFACAYQLQFALYSFLYGMLR